MSVFVVLVLVCLKVSCIALSRPPCSRRKWIQDLCRETRLTGGSLLLINSASVGAVVILDDDDDDDDGRVALPMNQKVGKVFRTRAMEEYTNSISASRDTNVSPMEAYDTITAMIPPNKKGSLAKALDVGAGAGYSTLLLYDKLGYKDIDAVDWSGDAWRSNVLETPPSVRFFELDDDSFFQMVETETSLQQQYGGSSSSSNKRDVDMTTRTKYQVICYNFAVNAAKAVRVARTHLAEDGMLLAPINDRPEYWYKQTYYVLNSRGEVLEQSGAEVGAWSVQFQPDVTSTTCSGIWCRNMNGFNEKRAKRQEQQQQEQQQR